MKQRPIACLALLVFLILRLLPAGLFYESLQVTEKCEVQVTGRVSRQIQKKEKTQIYLQDCQVQNEKLQFETKKLLLYLSDSTVYPVGTDLSLSGTIYPTEQPTNPGQFDSKLYYQGKGVAYTVYAEHVSILGMHPAPIREKLLHMQKKIGQVYENVLNEQDSSLLRAMVLGEKEGLDAEVKEFYQKNGMSHLLAISGVKTLNLVLLRGAKKPINRAFLRIHKGKIYIKKWQFWQAKNPVCPFGEVKGDRLMYALFGTSK